MIEINTWDWRFRVAFDISIREKVNRAIDEMNHDPSKKIMTDLLLIFKERLSVSELVSYCCEETGDNESALEAASGVIPLFLPKFLSDEYHSRVNKSNKLNSTEKYELNRIIQSATQNSFCNLNREIFEPIFGPYLDILLKKSVSKISPPARQNDISDESLLEVSKNIINSLEDITPSFLKETMKFIPNYEIEIISDTGFAEYWPKSLTKSEKDKLIIFDNDEFIGYQDLQATIAHEVLGHATFYNFIEVFQPPFFDHGSIAFVEGWATWCEWISSNDKHSKHLKSSRCQSLKSFTSTSPKKIQDDIIKTTLQKGYSKDVARSSIEYFFQYPGFRLSYTLGALWFEHRLSNIKPMEFFDSIKNKPWGDFFATW